MSWPQIIEWAVERIPVHGDRDADSTDRILKARGGA